jgi:hypothetical protein
MKLLIASLVSIAALAGCSSNEPSAPIAAGSSAAPIVEEGTDATAFCTDIKAFAQGLIDMTRDATDSLSLIEDLQTLTSQTTPVLENDAVDLSGEVGIDAQGAIAAIDAVSTTYSPLDIMPNIKAMNEPVASFVQSYC